MPTPISPANGSSAATPTGEGGTLGRLELRWHTDPVPPGFGTVVATGVFDLLHVGHLRFLHTARRAGERLLVGVEDDERARARKGPGRPIVPVAERCELLAALKPVDGVFVISGPPELDPVAAYSALLEQLRPSVLAFTEGDPATVGRQLVAEQLGAATCAATYVDGHSTSLLIGRLRAARRD